MKQIGIQIRQRRKMLGINQQTLADLAQISINTITKIENGEINTYSGAYPFTFR